MKNVKKLLSKQAKNILPDERVKESIRADLYGTESQKAYAHGETEATHNNKNIYMIIAAALALIIIICAVLPVIFRKSSSDSINNSLSSAVIESEDFYAYGAASACSIISRTDSKQSTSAAKTKLTAAGNTFSEQETADLVNEYIYYIEELLSGSSVSHTTTATDSTLSTTYAYTMTITYTDLLGDKVNYAMYFNESLAGSKTDKDEVETSYNISGIIIVGGTEYTITGGRSEETEMGETSSELWFRVETGENSYIQIIQEYEEETEDGQTETEQATEIYIYSNGECIESVIVETETEGTETELELKITKNNITFNIEFTLYDETVIYAETDDYEFRIYVEENKYRYDFGNNEYTYSRN